MKQIISHYNYTIVKDWSDKELESVLSDIQMESIRKIEKICPNCGNELSFILEGEPLGIYGRLICTYCHQEYQNC